MATPIINYCIIGTAVVYIYVLLCFFAIELIFFPTARRGSSDGYDSFAARTYTLSRRSTILRDASLAPKFRTVLFVKSSTRDQFLLCYAFAPTDVDAMSRDIFYCNLYFFVYKRYIIKRSRLCTSFVEFFVVLRTHFASHLFSSSQIVGFGA